MFCALCNFHHNLCICFLSISNAQKNEKNGKKKCKALNGNRTKATFVSSTLRPSSTDEIRFTCVLYECTANYMVKFVKGSLYTILSINKKLK